MAKFFAFFLLFFFACGNNTPNPNQKYVNYQEVPFHALSGTECPYQIVVIDSCEYVYVSDGNASWGSHKGNCKFCAERNKYKGEGPL